MSKSVKIIKRIFIIILCVILSVLIILIVTPLLFKDQLLELAKTELNKILLAKVDFKDLKLSFIRNFPDARVSLEGLEVRGIGEFDDELLVSFDRFNVTADIMSVIRMNIVVKSILLENARLNGRILENGNANWNIIKPGGEAVNNQGENAVGAVENEPFSFAFNVGLRRFEIRNLQAGFTDDKNKLKGGIQALNLILSGDMTKEVVDLNLELAVSGIDFWLDNVRMANNAVMGFTSEIEADLKNMDFTLKDNRFNLNEIVLKLDGAAGIKGSDITADITFATERTDFKSLLSLVPVVYMTNFSDLQTTGSLDLRGSVTGTYSAQSMPSADIILNVYDAAFKYPDLPKSIDGINIALNAHYDGEIFDRTTLDIDRFNFTVAGNPFNAEIHAKTLESDLFIAAKFAGKIDIDSITDIIPLDDMTLNGILECDITLEGNLSTIENEQYEDFLLEGHLHLSRFDFKTPDFPLGAEVRNMRINFTPRRVELAALEASAGSTDISVNGTLENFIPFILKNDTIRGTLALNSKTINLNQIMNGEKKEKDTETETKAETALGVIEVPKNVDFSLTLNAERILFSSLIISNTSGAVNVKDGSLVMRNLRMNLLEGSMTLNGEYNTRNMEVPFIDFDMDVRQFEISSALSSITLLEKIIPDSQNYTGNVSAALTINSVLGENLMPVLNSINSQGRLQTQNLQIRNSKLFGMAADLIKNEAWRTPSPGNVNIGYIIKDGKLTLTDPIVINVPPARMEVTGGQSLDLTMDYRIRAAVPISVIGSEAVNILGRIPGGSSVREVQLTGYVRGSPNNPEISLSVADMAGSVVDSVREQAIETVTQIAEDVRIQVNEEINRRIENIMAEANAQADNLRNTAKQAADRVRSEANSAADRAVSEAARISNPIERIAAQTAANAAANALRSEGETSARRIEQEAENQIQSLLADAQRRAEDLRRN